MAIFRLPVGAVRRGSHTERVEVCLTIAPGYFWLAFFRERNGGRRSLIHPKRLKAQIIRFISPPQHVVDFRDIPGPAILLVFRAVVVTEVGIAFCLVELDEVVSSTNVNCLGVV